MADFSVQATSLAAPTGAGSSPVAPVTVAPTETADLGVGKFPIVGEIVDIFAKGMVQSRKEEAEKRKNTIVQAYIRGETTINDAVESGQMSPAQAAARSRANFNQYAAGYGEYIEDFDKAGKALRGFTAKGEVEEKLKTEEKRLEADINQARERGFTFLPNMSNQARDAQINAAKIGIQSDRALQAQYQANAEKRAQGTFDAAVAAREDKDLSFRLINDIAGSNITAFQEFNKTLGDQVRNGTMTQPMALSALNERFANISGALQAAARTNPELASPYRSLFDDMYKIGLKLTDPKENADALQQQLTIKQTQMKLIAMNDSKIAAAVVANQLLPNNPSLALSSAPEGIRAITILSNTPVGQPGYVPQVVGNPDAEAPALKLLKGGLNDLKTGKVADKEVAKIQASNSVNQILKQTGEMIDKGGVGPAELKGVASFFASPEYAGFVTSGTIDPVAAGTAKKTFQLLYEPAIIRGVQERLSNTLARGLAEGGGASVVKAPAPTTLAEAVDIKFSGSGIVFEPKAKPGLAPSELRSQRVMVESLRSAQLGINQLIHIGAHMEGSTDYNKYWEENKHLYMPGYFLKGLKPGDVRNGYKYLGGNASVQSNYVKVTPSGGDE